MVLPFEPHVLGLDGDAALALEVHRVEVLRPHVAGVDRAGELEDPVGEGGLAVVDVGDDREGTEAVERAHPPILAVARGTDEPFARKSPATLTRSTASLSGVTARAMANIKSQIKRNRSNERRRQRNLGVRSELKTRVKHAREAIDTGDRGRAGDGPRRAEAPRHGRGEGPDPQEPGRPPHLAPDEAGERLLDTEE